MKKNIDNISKRFLKAIELTGDTGYKVSKKIKSISNSKLTHIRSGRNRPTLDMIEDFCEEYSNISLVWIVTGHSSPYSKDNVYEDNENDLKELAQQTINQHEKLLHIVDYRKWFDNEVMEVAKKLIQGTLES